MNSALTESGESQAERYSMNNQFNTRTNPMPLDIVF